MDPREHDAATAAREADERRHAERRRGFHEFEGSGGASRAAPVAVDDRGFDFGLRGPEEDGDARRRGRRRPANDDFETSRNY